MRKSRKPVPAPEEIQALRDEGLNREEIADHFGVSLTTVKRWISAFGVKKPLKRGGKRKQEPRRSLPIDHGVTLMERAQEVFGSRLTEDRWRGYLLDGKPIRTDELLARAGIKVPDEDDAIEARRKARILDRERSFN